ncbi:hypothetical protein B0H17DRAFT_1192057 [Mycena rosella]|uniref:Uncharacterized protein n=1 Tax=Mycena rosella TaxID=1033263 RepID=A0AAD7GY24_MYCRO|nr:hypothetical protein B0H17DRAFT_1192057 [Mycena rosella]
MPPITISEHLDARDFNFSLDSSTATARVAYVVCTTLRALATAGDDVLWDIYGDIISAWPGCTASKAQEMFGNAVEWASEYRRVYVFFVPSPSLAAFAAHLTADVEDLSHVLAMHHRSQNALNTIYILPFLPRVEVLIEAGSFSSENGMRPGYDMDVVLVSTAKTVVHETRHLVESLFHGAHYTPPMVQGGFPAPSKTNKSVTPTFGVQGEAGDWYEVCHYGAFLSPALVSSAPSGPGRQPPCG